MAAPIVPAGAGSTHSHPDRRRPRRRATFVRGLVTALVAGGALTAALVWSRWRSLDADWGAVAGWTPPPAAPAQPRDLAPSGEGILLEGFTADDVAVSPAGWALLDITGREVHVLDPAARPLRVVGRPGSGPGELQRPRAVALTADGSVAVLDGLARHIDLFPVAGGSDRIAVPDTGCPLGMGLAIAALPPDALLVQRQCMNLLFDRSFETLALGVDGSPVALEVQRRAQSMGDPFALPMHLVADGRVYAGDNRDPCLVPLQPDRGMGGSGSPDPAVPRCLPSPAAVAVSSARKLEYAALMGEHARRAGLEFPVPDLMPGAVEARMIEDRLAVRLHLDDRSRVWALHEGGTLVWASLPAGMRAEPGWGGWLVLADELAGQRVWFVPYDAPTPTG